MFPRKSFIQIGTYALIALCFLSSACQQKGTITEQQVRAFLDEMDKAAKNRDVDALVAKLSEDAEVKITTEGFGPAQTMSLNRDQYRDYSEQTFGLVRDYEYRRGHTVIEVDTDGQSALVADEIFETATIGGQVIRTIGRATSTLKLENGKLVITKSEGVARPVGPGDDVQPAKF
jgi:ketosteroid isomerase-like protein